MQSPPSRAAARRLLPEDAVERRALLAGVALAAISLAAFGFLLTAHPGTGRALALQWVAHTALSKETGIPVGLAAGAHPALSALAAFAQDAVVLLVGYPLACALARGTLRLPWVERFATRAHPRYDAFASRTEAWGVALLATSLWVPLLPSGALVAALAGRAAGYRPKLLIAAMLASALLSSVAYVALFAFAFSASEDPRAPWWIAGGAAALALVVAIAARVRTYLRRRGHAGP